MFICMKNIDIAKKPALDWHNADIKAALEKAGWSLRRLSIHHKYHHTSAASALARPWPKMERIIAKAIGVKPQEIWPSRYNEDGTSSRPMGRKPSKVNSTSTPNGCNVNKQKGSRYGT